MITLLSLIAFILSLIAMTLNNKLIKMFTNQRQEDLLTIKELNCQLNNAELRVVEHARTIKKVEDILHEGQDNNEFAVETISKIKKVLFPNGN